MINLKKLKKIALITIASLVLFFIAIGTLTYIYQDKVISLVVFELNKRLSTPVKVEKIDVSIWSKFPDVAIRFKDIEIAESIIPQEKPLLKASDVYLTFNLFNFLSGDYKIKELFIDEGETYIRRNKKGQINYNIFKKAEAAPQSEVQFDLDRIQITNITYTYWDQLRSQKYTGNTKNTSARLKVKGPDIAISLEGNTAISGIQIGDDVYFSKKNVTAKGDLNYNQNTDKLSIFPSLLQVNNSKFRTEGYFFNNPSNLIDLKIDGEDTDIQTILSLLPSAISGRFSEYKSEGAVYFNAQVTGAIKRNVNPEFKISYGCSNTSFYHPDLKQRIEKASFTGSFTNGKLRNYSTSLLKISNATGVFDGRPFKGNLLLEDFNSPFLNFDLDASIDISSLLKFYPMEKIQSAEGLMDIALEFQGQLSSLKKYSTSKEIKASGEITLKEVNFRLKQRELDFSSFNGNFIFSKNDLALNAFSGKVGNSDFLLEGLFRNVISYVLIPGQPLGIDASLKSSFLDFDQLLQDEKASESPGEAYRFKVAPDLVLRLDCNVKKARFRRFSGTNIRGKINLKDQKAIFTDIHLNAAGGKAELDGSLDASKTDFIQLETTSRYDNIHIDSVFYVFEDFNQNFISYKNLKGQIFADIKNYTVLNSKLQPDYNRLTAFISGSIKNGELIKFEPMQKLSRFVDEEALANLKFSELKNVVQIYKRTVYIPDMEIGSNVSNISIHGTHTFDQNIDYYLRVPLRNFRKRDKDEDFGAIESDGTGRSTLFLTIKGTADNYKIAYDKASVKQKLKTDIQKEKQEFLNIFKKEEPKKEEEKKLNEEEEYFDF